jgi:hypothetical protein
VKLTGHNADVLRRQADGSWRFIRFFWPGSNSDGAAATMSAPA